MGPRVRYDSHASSLASTAALGPSGSSYSLQQQSQRPPVDSWHPSSGGGGGGRASFDDGDDHVRLLPRTGSSSAYAPMPGGFDLSDPAPSHHPLYAPSVNDPNDSDDDDFGTGGGGVDNSASSRQMHYGPVPSRVPRRNKTVRKVELFMGHLVLDCPVPKRLLDSVREREGNEFGVMRYTAVTCDPDMFKADRYALRQILYPETRKTELFIVLTMVRLCFVCRSVLRRCQGNALSSPDCTCLPPQSVQRG
jgi:chitin synthase